MQANFKLFKILIVDDVPLNIKIARRILEPLYNIETACGGTEALELLHSQAHPDIILLDVMMPDMNGYEVLREIQSDSHLKDIPVIFLTSMDDAVNEKEGLELGARDYITKPVNPSILKARVANQIELKMHRDHLEALVTERTQELLITRDVTILSLSSLVETRDKETGQHIIRTQHYLKALALHVQNHPDFQAKLTDENIELMFKSAPLHDVGKVGVPDSILMKNGKLTEDEFDRIKCHTIYGWKAFEKAEKELGQNSFFRYVREIAYTHHEKWDGTGYPRGLKGEEIPLSGRLMAVADVYDSLRSKRYYKPAFSHEKTMQIMLKERHTHFDSRLIDALIEIKNTFIHIAKTHRDKSEKDPTDFCFSEEPS